ncbi:ribosome-binding protein ybzG [Bacillus tequilensis]|uniref:Ribosome-binding protein ybzG n=1 Tax=Bacillus tequilensis TaxID=227866 RepID=A0A6H0WG91_9BACI|nr:ribosome-binding protein ybzG [Bacillus tequilensis]QIW78507.1 ribosome-binding protein ybzG [Bacillus tequilensis]
MIGQKVWMNIGRTEFILPPSLELLTIINVLTADGEMRTLHSPNKKNINHLTLYDCVSPEVQNSINETGRVTNFF